ncbi:hypothetical protein AC578_524 [Pseudocercospora eumusae]|uniref:Uncharacterized protein n=1 Tax=Pseudocercospora eumusae TaxID=321146 RepID=A0A139HYB1_9PEZI|nr:hypothetical protein AC578_524 [Pseudocercospora eumusae]
MDVDKEQKIKRQQNAEHKKKEAAARRAIIDEILAQNPRRARDRSSYSTQLARAVPAERIALAKPKETTHSVGARSQQRFMHSGSTKLRTAAAMLIENTVSSAAEDQEEPIVEEKGDQTTCSGVPEYSMLDVQKRAANTQDRIREYKKFAARVEKRRQLEDAARAQTKQDDADAERHMLLAAELDQQGRAAQDRMVEDPIPPKLTPESAGKAHTGAVELAEVTEQLNALSTSQDAISFRLSEPPRSSIVLPAEKMVLGNMIQGERPHQVSRTRTPRKTLPDQSGGHDLFSHPQMALSDAAAQINICLNAARGVTSRWCEMGEDRFSNCLSDPLLQRHIEELTRDLSGIAAFLSYGRHGWELQDLPREFFEEAELLLPELRAHLTLVTQYKGGERLTGALKAMESIEAILKRIWLMKLAQGDQRPDEDMDEA